MLGGGGASAERLAAGAASSGTAADRRLRKISFWHRGIGLCGCGRSGFDQVLLDAQVLDDEVLPLGGVLAHEEGEEVVGAVEVVQGDRLEPDVLADEVLELAGGDFAQALEAGDLVAGARASATAACFSVLGVAVLGLLLVADAEERRLQDEEVTVADDARGRTGGRTRSAAGGCASRPRRRRWR